MMIDGAYWLEKGLRLGLGLLGRGGDDRWDGHLSFLRNRRGELGFRCRAAFETCSLTVF